MSPNLSKKEVIFSQSQKMVLIILKEKMKEIGPNNILNGNKRGKFK